MHGTVNMFEKIGLFYGDIDSLLPGIERSSGAVCCRVLQCVAVCCSVLQCVAVSELQGTPFT